MTRAALAAAFVLVALAGVARSAPLDGAPEGQSDGETAFRAALAAGDVDALEQLGAARPVTRWSDDAWSEAALLASRRSDFARARRDLEQVLAVGTLQQARGLAPDEQLARRARLELARLGGVAGAAGEWSAVASEHERLVAALLHTTGDPRPILRALEQLARAHAGYPRASSLMLSIATGWERDGDPGAALGWLTEARQAAATPLDRLHAHAELIRMLTRTGDLDAAAREIAALGRLYGPAATTGLVATLQHDLDRARTRRALRWSMTIVLAALALAALVALRCAAGAWRAVPRRLLRPPIEALFLVPIAGVLVIAAYTGNPLVARAVRTIAIAGVAASWISGAILDGRSGPRLGPTRRRLLIQAVLAVVAVGAATYLAVDTGHLIDFVIETWRSGPE